MGLIEYTFDGVAMMPLDTADTNRFKARETAGTNVNRIFHWTDDSTAYRGHKRFIIPVDIDASGTVTFGAAGVPQISGGTNLAWRFAHSPIAHGEDHDVAYSNVDSGDFAMPSTADDLVFVEWTETVANLGWSAHDLVYFYIERITAGASPATTENTLDVFRISIPTA